MKNLKLFLMLSFVTLIFIKPIASAARKHYNTQSIAAKAQRPFSGISESEWMGAQQPNGPSIMQPEEGCHLPFEGSPEKRRIYSHSTPRVFMVSLGEGYDQSSSCEKSVVAEVEIVPFASADRGARRVADGSGHIEGAVSVFSPDRVSVFSTISPEEDAYCRSLRVTHAYDDDDDVDTAVRPAVEHISTIRYKNGTSLVQQPHGGELSVGQEGMNDQPDAWALVPYGIADHTAFQDYLARALFRDEIEKWNKENLE